MKRKAQRFIGQWELHWPISRRIEKLRISLADRIFHFGSHLIFDRLNEFQITLELDFFNGNDETVVIERVAGLIIWDPPFDAFALEPPHLDVSQTVAEGVTAHP